MKTKVHPEDILDGHSGPVRQIAEQLRTIIKEVVPEAVEKAYPGWHGVGYTHPKAGYFCAIFPSADMVKLGFEYEALLPDPQHVLVSGPSKGSRVRYLEVRHAADVNEQAIQDLLIHALTLQHDL